jgi:hypothetical protein
MPGAHGLVGGTAASDGRQGSVRACRVASLWATLPGVGLMSQLGLDGRNVGARARDAGPSGANSAAHSRVRFAHSAGI